MRTKKTLVKKFYSDNFLGPRVGPGVYIFLFVPPSSPGGGSKNMSFSGVEGKNYYKPKQKKEKGKGRKRDRKRRKKGKKGKKMGEK